MTSNGSVLVDDFVAPPCDEEIKILYKDETILVINKPSGLLSLSGKNPLNKDSVHFRLVQLFPTALLVHRLDLGTSGVMVVALSKDVVKNLNQQFSNREVEKTYIALLHGHVIQQKGVLDYPIAKGIFPRQKICVEMGKPSQSEFEVLGKVDNKTKVRFKPLTGRTHQLRIHSYEFGHPIIGCDLYGTQASMELADRLMLHAESLSFLHPETKQQVIFKAPCPF